MELKTPIRIYWDLPPGPSRPARDLPAIAEEVLGSRALSLHLDAGPYLTDECFAVLERLRGERIAVTLTAPVSSLERAVVERLRGLGVKSLLAGASSLDELRAGVEAGGSRSLPPGWAPGISFALDASNYRDVPGLLSFCRREGFGELVFPICRAAASTPASYPDAAAREWLARELPPGDRAAGVRLTIHDPFVWKLFHPEQPFPEGTCQAANSMLYIAPDGVVHPCPALPYPLGRLGETTLPEILRSGEKAEVRRRLAAPPGDCRKCGALPQCLGGCRGRGFARDGSWDAADPACR